MARTEIERGMFPFSPPLLFQYPGSDVFPSPLERYFNISHFDFSSFFPILHFPPFCEKGKKGVSYCLYAGESARKNWNKRQLVFETGHPPPPPAGKGGRRRHKKFIPHPSLGRGKKSWKRNPLFCPNPVALEYPEYMRSSSVYRGKTTVSVRRRGVVKNLYPFLLPPPPHIFFRQREDAPRETREERGEKVGSKEAGFNIPPPTPPAKKKRRRGYCTNDISAVRMGYERVAGDTDVTGGRRRSARHSPMVGKFAYRMLSDFEDVQ